jgi:hypothetical protein
MAHDLAHPHDAARQRRFTIGACVLLAVAAFYLWTEHRAHLLGALPYIILLACPVMHHFMHHGHGGHSGNAGHEHEQRSEGGGS